MRVKKEWMHVTSASSEPPTVISMARHETLEILFDEYDGRNQNSDTRQHNTRSIFYCEHKKLFVDI